jgi:hypothetical protein
MQSVNVAHQRIATGLVVKFIYLVSGREEVRVGKFRSNTYPVFRPKTGNTSVNLDCNHSLVRYNKF